MTFSIKSLERPVEGMRFGISSIENEGSEPTYRLEILRSDREVAAIFDQESRDALDGFRAGAEWLIKQVEWWAKSTADFRVTYSSQGEGYRDGLNAGRQVACAELLGFLGFKETRANES